MTLSELEKKILEAALKYGTCDSEYYEFKDEVKELFEEFRASFASLADIGQSGKLLK